MGEITTLSCETIEHIGFAAVGEDAPISKRESFYGTDRIDLGTNVRIGDFCARSARERGISIGQLVHIAAYFSFIGAAKTTLSGFTGSSSRVYLCNSNDNYFGATTRPAR